MVFHFQSHLYSTFHLSSGLEPTGGKGELAEMRSPPLGSTTSLLCGAELPTHCGWTVACLGCHVRGQ
jgi:hypothetical protein